MIQAIGGWDGNASSKPFFFYARCTAVILFYRGHPLSTFARGGGGLKTRRREKGYTVCPKVPVNSNVVDFSAISGPILKPFDLQVATLGRFDMMYNMP